MESTRFQSVFEAFEVDRLLISVRLAHRHDANDFIEVEVYDNDHALAQSTHQPKAMLAVVEALIERRQRVPAEHLCAIAKIEPVLAEVLAALALVPFEDHAPAPDCSYIS